ncbi:flavin reductase family protein [Luteococcus sp.]|uniref:flavin reductase family protein n=1 Tax=Luteococcus sp. TaxID=1969402 RepID=UPI003735A9DC
MTIHASHPFADDQRDQARALRGRLGGRVCLLTAGEGRARAGWTVSSLLLVDGPQWQVVAMVDPDSDLAERIGQTGRAVLHLLEGPHRYLADVFAGLAPAPGGAFRGKGWTQTNHGPRLDEVGNWAALELEHSTELGWSQALVLRVVEAVTDADPQPLHHVRGHYRTLED